VREHAKSAGGAQGACRPRTGHPAAQAACELSFSRCCMSSSMVHPGVDRCSYSAYFSTNAGYNRTSKCRCCSSTRRAFSSHAGPPRRRGAAAGVPGRGGTPGENRRATGCDMQGPPLAGAARLGPARSRGIPHMPPGHRGERLPAELSADTVCSTHACSLRGRAAPRGCLRSSPVQSVLSNAQPLDRSCFDDDRGQRAACASGALRPCTGDQAGMGLRRAKITRRVPARWTALQAEAIRKGSCVQCCLVAMLQGTLCLMCVSRVLMKRVTA